MIRYSMDSILLTAFTIVLVVVIATSLCFGLASVASRKADGSTAGANAVTADEISDD